MAEPLVTLLSALSATLSVLGCGLLEAGQRLGRGLPPREVCGLRRAAHERDEVPALLFGLLMAPPGKVRERQQFYAQAGIRSVPAVIINDRHLISGGQPVEVFEQALRRIASGEVA